MVSARAILAALVTKKLRKKRLLIVQVFFADTGALKSEVLSPFQKSAYRNITVVVFDSNGNGVADTVRLTARRGKKTVARLLTV